MSTGYNVREGSQMLTERFATPSQCARILSVLRDGKPHLVSEIHALAGYSRLNSRVAELRKRGYDIQSYHLPGKTGSEGYGYTLCSEEGSPSELSAAEVSPSSASSEQLSLVAA